MNPQNADHSTIAEKESLIHRNEQLLQAEEEGNRAGIEPWLIHEFTIIRASAVK